MFPNEKHARAFLAWAVPWVVFATVGDSSKFDFDLGALAREQVLARSWDADSARSQVGRSSQNFWLGSGRGYTNSDSELPGSVCADEFALSVAWPSALGSRARRRADRDAPSAGSRLQADLRLPHRHGHGDRSWRSEMVAGNGPRCRSKPRFCELEWCGVRAVKVHFAKLPGSISPAPRPLNRTRSNAVRWTSTIRRVASWHGDRPVEVV